jgi:hypothetical protein
MTSNILIDSRSSTFICETSNEGARVEKEFKIFVHGQFPIYIFLLEIRSFSSLQSFQILNWVSRCSWSSRNEALEMSLYTLIEGRGSMKILQFSVIGNMMSKGLPWFIYLSIASLVATGIYMNESRVSKSNFTIKMSRETRNCAAVYTQNKDRGSTFNCLQCFNWKQARLICLEKG